MYRRIQVGCDGGYSGVGSGSLLLGVSGEGVPPPPAGGDVSGCDATQRLFKYFPFNSLPVSPHPSARRSGRTASRCVWVFVVLFKRFNSSGGALEGCADGIGGDAGGGFSLSQPEIPIVFFG